MTEEETKNTMEQKPEENGDKKRNSLKGDKTVIDKEEIERELQDGIQIEAKLYSPSEKYCQMEKYNLTDAEFFALLESLPQKRKARLILTFNVHAFELVTFNSDSPDRKLPHHQIPMMWSPKHRGRPILGIAVEVNGKYDIVVLKLDDNKGEAFINKVRFAYREKLLAGPQDEETQEPKAETTEAKEEVKEETKEKSGLTDLVDFDAEPVSRTERANTLELFSTADDWAKFGAPTTEQDAPSASLADIFAPQTEPQKFSGLQLPAPPSGKQSPVVSQTSSPFAAPSAQAAPWGQGVTQPFPAHGMAAFNVTSAAPTEGSASRVFTPITVGQPFPQTSVGQPFAQASVGQPFPQASVGQPFPQASVGQPFPQASVGQPFPQASVGQPSLPQISVVQPSVSQGSLGPSPFTQGSLGQPSVSQGSLGPSPFTQGSLGQPSVSQGSLGPSPFTQGSLGQPSVSQGSLGQPSASQGSLGPPPFTQSSLGSAFSAMTVSNGNFRAPPQSAGAPFAVSAPNTPLLGLTAEGNRLSPMLQSGGNPFAGLSDTNPFAAPAPPTSAADAFPMGSELMGMMQPQPLKTNTSSESFDFLESSGSIGQKGAPASAAKFDDLLASADPGFKPMSQGLATPRDMFAARQQKPKSLPLNDILSQ